MVDKLSWALSEQHFIFKKIIERRRASSFLSIFFFFVQERFARRGISTRLRQIFDSIDTSLDSKIDSHELSFFLKKLGYCPHRDIIENMIWEVDEDHDGKVGWEEFQRAYERCSNDIYGTEPRQLYNVVLFLLHITSVAGGVVEEGKSVDRNGGKEKVVKMSGEDAKRLMYLQFGRVRSRIFN